MIMLGLYVTNKVPFREVYLHGLVRDATRQKMSKSKGNVLNPIEVAEKYGTDALRMALLVGNTPGQDMALAEDKIKANKLFANKVWNIARFVLSQERTGEIKPELKKEFDAVATEVTEDIEHYRVYLAAEKLYHYLWGRFAAEILEESKGKPECGATLYYILENSLKLLHPFMPFVTEEIWGSMPGNKELLMIEEWPIKKAL
jgi:valyl-tRNA synthetase